MRVDFQYSIAGSVDVTDEEGLLEASSRLADLQRGIQYSSETYKVKIDGITLGWKERPLTPLEIMQAMEKAPDPTPTPAPVSNLGH